MVERRRRRGTCSPWPSKAPLLEKSLSLPQPSVFYSQSVLCSGLQLLQGCRGAGDAEQRQIVGTFQPIAGRQQGTLGEFIPRVFETSVAFC